MGLVAVSILGGAFLFLNQSSSSQTLSVPGMSKYIDADFGFSFWYPSRWKVSNASADLRDIAALTGYISDNGSTITSVDSRTVSKTLEIQAGKYVWYVQEVHSPSGLVSTYGYSGTHLHFDSTSKQWMNNDDSQSDSANQFHPSHIVATTIGGLPVLLGAIVPLSPSVFIIVGVDNGGDPLGRRIQILPLVKTISSTDPSVVTPVSADEQIKTIQAEKDAYAGQ